MGPFRIIEENEFCLFRITETTDCSFVAHLHITPEFIYVTQGSVLAWVEGQNYVLNKGDLCLILGYKLHSYQVLSSGCFLRAVFDSELFGDFKALNQTDWYDAVLIQEASRQEDMASVLFTLQEECHHGANALVITGYLRVLLGKIEQWGVYMPAHHVLSPGAERVVTYICENFNEPITLENVSVGISRYQVSRICNHFWTPF